jgi:hypothetical protein
MAEMSTSLMVLPASTPTAIVPKEIAARLPDQILERLAQLPPSKQAEFVAAFHAQSRSLSFAYLTSLIYCHYGLLGRWTMTGLMWVSLFLSTTLGPALGSIWWLIDLVRMPGMVRSYNQQLAADLLRKLNTTSDTAPQPGS